MINNPTSYGVIGANLDHRTDRLRVAFRKRVGRPQGTGKGIDIKIAIIGAGNVGSTLGTAWRNRGPQVAFGVRNPDDPKYASLGAVETNESATAPADVVVL